jgi:hypothetical protein
MKFRLFPVQKIHECRIIRVQDQESHIHRYRSPSRERLHSSRLVLYVTHAQLRHMRRTAITPPSERPGFGMQVGHAYRSFLAPLPRRAHWSFSDPGPSPSQ